MDTNIFDWEMNADSEQTIDLKEEIALWPSETFILDIDAINCN